MNIPILCFVAAQAVAAQGGLPNTYPAEFGDSGTLERGFESAKRSSGPSTTATTSLAAIGIILRAPKRYRSN
jgi:hypothetical protein